MSDSDYQQTQLLSINASQIQEQKNLFKQVCHSDFWVTQMCESSPFESLDDLLKKGEAAWSKCKEADWKQALDGHPRIGDKQKGQSLSASWSRGEQSQAATPNEATLEKLKQAQEQYFQKFGFIFLICATGKSSGEILRAAESRLANSQAEELQIIAQEQAKIIQLRLEKLLKP